MTTDAIKPPAAAEAPARDVRHDVIARRGVVLAVGATAMAITFYLYPVQPGGIAGRVGDVGGLAFQAGLFMLWLTYQQTQAAGTGRRARTMLRVVLVLLTLATLWSALHLILPNSYATAWPMLVLDACWPLSMIGFLIVGIMIAAVGRWRGPLRWAPLAAEAWAPLTIGLTAILPTPLGNLAMPTLLILCYGTLAVLLVIRPDLTDPHTSRANRSK